VFRVPVIHVRYVDAGDGLDSGVTEASTVTTGFVGVAVAVVRGSSWAGSTVAATVPAMTVATGLGCSPPPQAPSSSTSATSRPAGREETPRDVGGASRVLRD